MNLPEHHDRGFTDKEPEFVAIEETFWTRKPNELFSYDPKNSMKLSWKEPPTIDLRMVQRIWGTDWRTRLIPSSHIAHLSVFAIPAFIDSIDTRNESFGSDPKHGFRFSEDFFDDAVGTFWTSHASALGIEGRRDPEDLRMSIGLFHSSSRSHRHFDPSYHNHRGEFVGIPESSLAFSVYEVVRVGEDLARQSGIDVPDEARNRQYEYFRDIVRDGGIWMPDTREEMEDIACALDGLSRVNSATLILTERTVRRVISKLPAITYDQIFSILRPGAQTLFAKICTEYGYIKNP